MTTPSSQRVSVQTSKCMADDPLLPCNFSNHKLSFYVPSDFSIAVLERYGPDTHTIVFGVIQPNARFRVTRPVLATLFDYAHHLPNLECIFSCSGNVADDVTDEDILPLVRTFRGLKSIYLDGYKNLTDRTFIAILYACPDMEEIIISAGDKNQGLLTQKSLGAFFNQPRVGTKVTRVELLHQSPSAFTDDIILPLVYDFATLSREFKFWKTAPETWEGWKLPEPGEVGRDEVQRKIAFGPEWFKKKSIKERLKLIESWQSWGDTTGTASPEKSPGIGKSAGKGNNAWKGSIRKRMLGGLL
jgi:hypothetical protein